MQDGSAFPLGTNMTDVVTADKVANDQVPAKPRYRSNRLTTLPLTVTWQPIDFDGTSPFNLNGFPIDAGQTVKRVSWDATNKLLKFTGERNYTVYLSTAASASALLGLLGVVSGTLQLRYVIPRPAAQGGEIAGPLPNKGGFTDVGPVNSVAQTNKITPFPIFSNSDVQAYGLQFQARLSNGVGIGTVNLEGADLNIFST